MPYKVVSIPAGTRPAPNFTLIAQSLIEELGLDTTLTCACARQVVENLVLLNRKQHDYGSTNLTKFGVFGVVVRTSDKVERLATLTQPGADAPKVADEKIADTLGDLANYGLIGQVLAAKKWPL